MSGTVAQIQRPEIDQHRLQAPPPGRAQLRAEISEQSTQRSHSPVAAILADLHDE